jgi:hypothetical protein
MRQPAQHPSSSAPDTGIGAPARGNAGYPWDDFDAEAYLRANYTDLRDDDHYLLAETAAFLSEMLPQPAPHQPLLRGIDVGTGANLYPAFTMLPYCGDLDLWERGGRSTRWLESEVRSYSPLWDKYWDVLTQRDRYRMIDEPRERLSRTVRIRRDDLYRLPSQGWDVGTMFFAAESISDRRDEFELAVERFVGALRPGAPFATAFMRDSHGYPVDDQWFPAVAIGETDVKACLAPLSHDLRVSTVVSDAPLRDGYRGMILALGVAGG